jgi:hypothetical protein
MKYAYNAAVTETGTDIKFPDFPDSPSNGSLYEPIHDVATKAFYAMLQIRFDKNEMIPLPSLAQDGEEYITISESAATAILRRNWEVAQAYHEARELFNAQNREAIRKARKGKNNDSSQAQGT